MFTKLKKLGWNVYGENNGPLIAKHLFKHQMKQLDDSLSVFRLTTEEGLIAGGKGKAIPTVRLTKSIESLGWLENTIEVENDITFSNSNQKDITSFFSSHKIDHIGSGNNTDYKFALEIEWNNKDEFFDRDLVAIRGLYETRAIEIGIIITRGEGLEEHIKKKILKYFKKENINSYQDFINLKKKLKGKNYKFTFPSSSQKTTINGKIKKGLNFTQASQEVFVSNKYGSTTTNWGQINKRIKRRVAGRTPLIILGIPPGIVS